MNSKYSLGDKVKVTQVVNGAPEQCVGKVGTIIRVFGGGKDQYYEVDFSEEIGCDNTWFLCPDEIVKSNDTLPSPGVYMCEPGVEVFPSVDRNALVDMLIAGLTTDGAHHKQYYLEEALRMILNDDAVNQLRHENFWERGIPS